MVTFLRFGDSVMLHCIENNQTMFDGESLDTKQNSQGYQGFLTGLGFTDEGVYVQLERQDNLRMIHQPSEIIDKIPTSRNSRHYMFQLTPRLNYEAHEDLEKNMRYYKELRMNNFFAKKDFEKYRKMKL
jgi:hypothetical protein